MLYDLTMAKRVTGVLFGGDRVSIDMLPPTRKKVQKHRSLSLNI